MLAAEHVRVALAGCRGFGLHEGEVLAVEEFVTLDVAAQHALIALAGLHVVVAAQLGFQIHAQMRVVVPDSFCILLIHIAKSKKSYEKSFLYTEADNNDIGYFVAYNLRVLDLSFKQLQGYLKRKQEEKKAANTFLQLGDINDRQAQIIKMFVDNPKEVITVKDIQSKFFVSATTAKGDIMGLVDRGLINEFAFNKVKRGYVRSDKFEEAVKPIIK